VPGEAARGFALRTPIRYDRSIRSATASPVAPGADVIRFSCPHCNRAYVLADALAHLPLVCKGCGQRLAVPDPTPEPDAPPPPVPVAVPPPPPPVAVAPPVPPPAPGDDFLSSAALAELDIGKDEAKLLREPPPELLGPVKAAAPVRPPPPAATPPRSRKLIPNVADAAAVLVLLVAGVLVGEVVVKKSTRDILTEAGSAPKFPPVDLLLWLGCAGFFVLVYTWLGTRGWTVGGWLKRRAG
jgi:hypothetical protein